MATTPDSALTAPFQLGFTGPGVLLLHGFTGSPWDVRPLGESLAAAGFRVHAPRLPGHGASPEDMRSVRAGDWRAVVEGLLSELSADGAPVHLVGLSMGALLLASEAARRPASVGGLVLLAPALRLRGLDARVSTRLAPLGLLPRLKPWIFKSTTDLHDPEALAQAPILPAYPSARLEDLRQVQRWARRDLPMVQAPTLIMDAAHDRVVRPAAAREVASLLRRSARVRRVHLARGGHILPRDYEGPRVAKETIAFLRSCTPGIADEASAHRRSG